MASTYGHVRLGTRGSPMALWQARWVAETLRQQHPGLTTEIVVIRTAGDRNRHDPLPRIGGKGLFVKEIEDALLRQSIDLAVHSMKDVPTTLPPGLHLSAVPPRDDVRDVFVGRDGRRLTALDLQWAYYERARAFVQDREGDDADAQTTGLVMTGQTSDERRFAGTQETAEHDEAHLRHGD